MAVAGKRVVGALLALAVGVTLLFIGLTLANLDKIRTSVAVRRSSRPILKTPSGEMVIVPEGEFQVPSWENPPKLPAFYIDKEPVSPVDYRRFAEAAGRDADRIALEDERAYCEQAGKRLPSPDELAKAGRGSTPENDVSIYGVRGLAGGRGFRCALDLSAAEKFR